METMVTKNREAATSGYCHYCGKTHYLKQGRAGEYCLELIKALEENRRIDIHITACTIPPKQAFVQWIYPASEM